MMNSQFYRVQTQLYILAKKTLKMQNKTCAWNNKRSAAVSNCSYTYTVYITPSVFVTFQLMNIKKHLITATACDAPRCKIKFKLKSREERLLVCRNKIVVCALATDFIHWCARRGHKKNASLRTCKWKNNWRGCWKPLIKKLGWPRFIVRLSATILQWIVSHSSAEKRHACVYSAANLTQHAPDVIIVSCMLIRIKAGHCFILWLEASA